MRNNLKTVHFFALFLIFLGHGCIIPESNHVAPDFYLLSDLALPAEQALAMQNSHFISERLKCQGILKNLG